MYRNNDNSFEACLYNILFLGESLLACWNHTRNQAVVVP